MYANACRFTTSTGATDVDTLMSSEMHSFLSVIRLKCLQEEFDKNALPHIVENDYNESSLTCYAAIISFLTDVVEQLSQH